MKRSKGKKQSRKGRGRKQNGASSGTDLWKKIGYTPGGISKKELRKKSYQTRVNLPEGKGTSRSEGSNKRLEWLLHRR